MRQKVNLGTQNRGRGDPERPNAKYLTASISYDVYKCGLFYKENDKYKQIMQASDVQSLCGFEVRTPIIAGLKIVVVVISVLILMFIRSLLCARYCSKYFIYINLFNFQNSPLRYILQLVAYCS